MDKFREDFKDDFEYLDWIKAHPNHKRKEITAEDGKDPTAIYIDENELQEWIKKYGFRRVDEWVAKLRSV